MSKWMRLLVTTGMLYAGLVAVAPAIRAGELEEEAGKCCQYGSECEGVQLCCDPNHIGAYPCSTMKQGYCRSSCN
jgi:hypothetical protein